MNMPWYTWVFSGLGTVILVSALTALYRKYRTNESSGLASSENPQNRRQSTEPTPIQIGREVKAHLPIDRDHARQKYIGLNVTWKGTFRSLDAENQHCFENSLVTGKQSWRIFCQFGSNGSDRDAGIFFNLTLLPPEIKVLREGSTVWIKGKIKYASEIGGFSSITLEDDPAVCVIKPRTAPSSTSGIRE